MKIQETYSLDNLVAGDIVNTGANKLLSQGYRIRADNKMAPISMSKSHIVPWVYVLSDENKRCQFWHSIVFDTFELFPIGCLNCWKVVVRPRSVKELFLLHEYQDNEYRQWRNGRGFCKCGIEVRKYVHGNYGGYFYNDSLKEGLESYQKVREDISKHINPNVPVILKRACTEFELKYGDSTKWEEILIAGEYTNADGNTFKMSPIDALLPRLDDLERHIDTFNEGTTGECMETDQPGYVKIAVMRSWLEHAYSLGDPTALEFNKDGGPFYTPPKTYHDKTNHDFDKYNKFTIKEAV